MIPPCLCNFVAGVLESELCNDCIKHLFCSLFNRLGYLVYPKKKAEKLVKATKDLQNKRNDIKRKTDAAEGNCEIVDDVVLAWLKEVDDVEVEVGTISKEAKDIRKCFKGCCPNFVGRYKIGKRISEKLIAVAKLKNEGVFDKVAQPSPPARGIDKPERDFTRFRSTKEAMDKISEAMQNNNQQLIGIYGMGGVGKTTIMDKLSREFSDDDKYGMVISVIVSQNPNIVQIRRNIALDLGMSRFRAGDENAAGKLNTRLKKESKIVIMIDDIWNRLDLADVGIPTAEHRGCKVLFTTRTLRTCEEMDCHASIEVKLLSEKDSWTLFENKVGEVCNEPDIKPIANEVAKECGGLPLALVVLGRAMRNKKRPAFWSSALAQFKQSCFDELPGVEDNLHRSLMLSYDYIPNEEMRLLFLFCCLFPEDYEISEDELTWYAAGGGFLENTNTLAKTRNKVVLLVEDLISSCLLIRCEKEGCVKMHDVIRDVAVNIASKENHHFYVKAGLHMKDWLAGNEPFEKFKSISLMNNDITTLKDQPNCPKLVTLLLNVNPNLNSISNEFFRTMESLTVLDLSDTNIESLPASLAILINLGLLRLDRCKNLKEISIVGKLSKLKLLGLRMIKVEVFPEEIKCLTNLKLLDISHASFHLIPPDLICKLSQLEELFMIGSEGYDSEALVSSVGSLERLVHLQMLIDDPNCFSQDFGDLEGWKNLSRFKVLNSSDTSDAFKYDKFLSLKNVNKLGNWTKRLFSEAECLMLDSCVWDAADSGTLVNVKKLQLTNCSNIDGLLNTTDISSSNTFPSHTFANLRELEVVGCSQLKYLFMPSLVGELQNLEKMVVKKNSSMEVIIGHEDNVEIKEKVFPRLKVMELVHLPELKNFYLGESKSEYFDWPLLESVKFESCKNMEWIPFGVKSAPKLKKINVADNDDIEWFNKLKREDPNIV